MFPDIHFAANHNERMGRVYCKSMWVNKMPPDRPMPEGTHLGTDSKPSPRYYFYTVKKESITCKACLKILEEKNQAI